MRIPRSTTQVEAGAFEVVFREYQPQLVRRIALIVQDVEDAKDVVQVAFARAAEQQSHLPEVELRSWVTVVALRLALTERRKRRRWGLFPIQERDATWALRVDPDLWRALERLDARSRAALVLTVLDGYTQEEVAAALGVARGTVASWLFRAREQLRPLLEVHDEGP